MMGYYIVAGLIFLASSYISKKLKSKFKHYSEIQLKNGMSGREIAEKMLADNSILMSPMVKNKFSVALLSNKYLIKLVAERPAPIINMFLIYLLLIIFIVL